MGECGKMSPPDETPRAILIVEDDITLRRLLHRALEHAGYAVASVGDGRAAKRHVQNAAVDLVVTDIYMPETDGIDLVMHLRGVAPQLPVIAMSAGYRGHAEAMLDVVRHLGVRQTLEKPFSLQVLLDAVRENIGR